MRARLAAIALWASVAGADEFFEKNIRPLFAERCYTCHSSQVKAPFAGLRLDTRASAMRGGDRGPVILPGRPQESRLIRAIRGELPQRMPPTGKLSDDQIAALETWIARGAPWPEEKALMAAAANGFDLEERHRTHWVWQPVRKITSSPLDEFEAGPPVNRATLARRVYFDLHGLPPSPQDILAFQNDSAPDAYEKLVDRLLASPRFGERFARRWMDLVRYAESHGSEGDPDTAEAWRYRDYLIRAFNDDVPYDQLIREHLAGDLLPNPRLNAKEKVNESLLATSHLRMVEHGFQPVDPWEDRVKWTDNQIDVFSKAFQGLTVSCARCHDHKFDAISQKDFYALFGVFAGARPVQKAIDLPEHLNRNREQLERLRLDIRDKLVEAWLEAAPSLTAAEAPKHLAVKAKTQWDLRKDFNQWLSLGTNVRLAPPGEFAIEPNGAQVISGIYPGGVYTHLLSPKHNGVIQSPRFKIDTDFISVRMLGGNFSFAQLIIENYPVPRGGIYNIRHSPKKDEMSWTRWDVAYWKGFTAYVEFATMEDATHFFFDDEALGMKPRPEPKRDGRSWFGAQQVVFHNAKELPKEESVHGAQSLEDAIRAWRSGNMTEDQAAFLDHFVRRGLLPNTLEKLPGLKPLVAEYRKLEEEAPVPRRAPAVLEESAPDQLLLIRGNHKSPGEAVPRRYLSALGSRTYDDPRLVRLRLAEEVASADNPLTARVMVNRLWSYYFRQGIVRTVDNFGKLGEPPSNPELLDWLATRFIADGWSIKKMTRLLVTSRAYQAGMPLRRLEAEEIRDAVLAVSGELDLAMYGPSVPVYYAHETGKTKGDRPKGPLDGKGRRSVYLEIRRNATNPFLEVFDAPKPASTRGARDVTNVPAQSLAMMNSDFMIDQADRWAGRLVADGAWTPADRVDRMFARAFGRVPSSEERDLSLSLIEDFAREHKAADVSGDRRVWRDFAQALFSLKEFVYVR